MSSTSPSQPDTRPRRRHWPLYLSILLLLVFAALVVHQIEALRPRLVVTNEDLLKQLASAEFLEDRLPASPGARDWPQWRGRRRDGVAGTGPLQLKWPGVGLEKIWGNPIGESYSSFAVTGGRLYTQTVGEKKSEQVILCLDANTGKEIWRESNERPDLKLEYGNIPRSTPVVDGDLVFTVDQGGRLQCRQADTGKLEWERKLIEDYGGRLPNWGVAFSPLVLDGLVYTNPGGKDNNSIIAFDRKTGAVVWTALNDLPGYSSPVAINVRGLQQVVFFTEDGVVGLTAKPPTKEGKLLWRFPWAPATAKVNAATPLAFRTKNDKEEDQYVFISSGYNKGCALLRIEMDNQGKCQARPVFTSNQLCCLFSSPVRCKDHVYGFNNESFLTCMSLRDGTVKWKERGYHRGNLLLAEPTQGEPMLLVLGEEGHLALIDAEPTPKAKLESKTQPVGIANEEANKCWVMPVVAEGKIYVRDKRQIVCLKLPEAEANP